MATRRVVAVACGIFAFVTMGQQQFTCNDMSNDPPEVQVPGNGIVFRKDNLRNYHSKWEKTIIPGTPDTKLYEAQVLTDWSYTGQPANRILTRHSDGSQGVTDTGFILGWHVNYAYYWSSGCSADFYTCLTRREVQFQQRIFSPRTVCIGTRIYGFRSQLAGRPNHSRNITEHGCPGDSAALGTEIPVAPDFGTANRTRARAVQQIINQLSAETRARIKRDCHKVTQKRTETGVVGVVTPKCARTLTAALEELPARWRRRIDELQRRWYGDRAPDVRPDPIEKARP